MSDSTAAEQKKIVDCEVPTLSGKATLSYGRDAQGIPDFVANERIEKEGKGGVVQSVTEVSVRGCGNDVGFLADILVAKAADAARRGARLILAGDRKPGWKKGNMIVVTVSYVAGPDEE